MQRRTSRACARTLALGILVLASSAMAQAPTTHRDAPLARIHLQHDSIIRWAPRFILTAEDQPVGLDRVYWRRVDQIPLYERFSMSATNLADGRVDAHLSAWGAVDLANQGEGGLAGDFAGDLAIAYARVKLGPVRLWAGRRFLPWGPTGGVHVDAIGAELAHESGLFADLFVGRPVTPSYDSLLGPSSSLEDNFQGTNQGATVAYGARVGYRNLGRFTVTLDYVERWAHGIPADRVLSVNAAGRLGERVDFNGNVKLDASGFGVEQATARMSALLGQRSEVDLEYSHVDPRRLFPSWSIFSVFETRMYEEGAAGFTWRSAGGLAFRLELALRYGHFPGDEQINAAVKNDPWGYRGDGYLRWTPTASPFSLLLQAGGRSDGDVDLIITRAVGAWASRDGLRLALELAAAIPKGTENRRTAAFSRFSADVPFADSWFTGASFDVARTAFSDTELRGLLRLGFHTQWEASNP